MIAADHWHDNGDGTAWLVTTAAKAFGEYGDSDRPCDTCDGDMVVHGPNQSRHEAARHALCPDCIDGRHTFEIEVECATYEHDHIGGVKGTGRCPHNPSCDRGILTHRVSVVPGMVLPIYDGYETRPVGHIWINSDGDAWLHDINESYVVALPPAAAPGMWAVLVKVAS